MAAESLQYFSGEEILWAGRLAICHFADFSGSDPTHDEQMWSATLQSCSAMYVPFSFLLSAMPILGLEEDYAGHMGHECQSIAPLQNS